MKSVNLIKKRYIIAFFVIIILMYSLFILLRPYEDDESQYIIAGKAIIDTKLNPFKINYENNYSNPFQYIMGSPIVPILYGICYKLGGLFFVRIIASLFVLFSIFLVYRIIKKIKGNMMLPLTLIAFSSSTILLASDGILDSVALFFLIYSLYSLLQKKMFLAGIFSSFAMISKFVLIFPIAALLIYYFANKNWKQYLLGISIVIIPFLFLYKDLIPILIKFVLENKVNGLGVQKLKEFLNIFFWSLPILSISLVLFFRYKLNKDLRIFFIVSISVIFLQTVLLDYVSFMRHLPYAEFSAAILLSATLKNYKIKFVWLLLALFTILSVYLALENVANYPSYNSIEKNLTIIKGKVLALNVNSFLLINHMPYNSTANNIYSYYYFNYDRNPDSKISEYEQALKDGFFDFATIPSVSSNKYPRFKMIEDLVRKEYCPIIRSNKPNCIDIYGRCNGK